MSRLDAVVSALDSVIEWSITASSRLGYFAALYKRITIAVAVAVKNGAFEDGPRMELFDASFASRYFDALKATSTRTNSRDRHGRGKRRSMPPIVTT